MMKPLKCLRGLTIKELKDLINSLPETDSNGESYTVWIETGDYISSLVTQVWPLNKKEDGSDILLQ